MIVNAALHLLGREVSKGGAEVALVGKYEPTRFGFGQFSRGVRPSGHALAPR
jgi:hypothetical protein